MAANGLLPASELRAIPGGRLRNDAAASWLRLRARIGREANVWICPTSPRTAYRTLAEQQFFWRLWTTGRGSLAARPGTSNHGWGLAVDVPTTTMARLINRYGAEYGWQKRWSDAPSEWWHFKYRPEFDRHKGERVKPKHKHPYHYLTDNEKKWRNVLVRNRRIARRKGGWDKVGENHLKLAKRSKAELRRSMRKIERNAKATGWNKHHRRVRHRYLKELLHG